MELGGATSDGHLILTLGDPGRQCRGPAVASKRTSHRELPWFSRTGAQTGLPSPFDGIAVGRPFLCAWRHHSKPPSSGYPYVFFGRVVRGQQGHRSACHYPFRRRATPTSPQPGCVCLPGEWVGESVRRPDRGAGAGARSAGGDVPGRPHAVVPSPEPDTVDESAGRVSGLPSSTAGRPAPQRRPRTPARAGRRGPSRGPARRSRL